MLELQLGKPISLPWPSIGIGASLTFGPDGGTIYLGRGITHSVKLVARGGCFHSGSTKLMGGGGHYMGKAIKTQKIRVMRVERGHGGMWGKGDIISVLNAAAHRRRVVHVQHTRSHASPYPLHGALHLPLHLCRLHKPPSTNVPPTLLHCH